MLQTIFGTLEKDKIKILGFEKLITSVLLVKKNKNRKVYCIFFYCAL